MKSALPKEIMPVSTKEYDMAVVNIDSDPKNKSEQLDNEIEKQEKILKENFDKFIVTVRPLFVFLIGAVIGAKTMEVGTFWSNAIPLFLLLVIFCELILKYSGCAS
jgi:hypothetical protein